MAGRGGSAEIGADKAEMIQWLFANSRDLIHVVDAQGKLRLVNPAWVEAAGLSEDELIGRPIHDLIHPDDVAALRQRMARARPEGVSEGEIRVRLAGGGWGWFALRTQRLDSGDHIVTLRKSEALPARAAELAEARRAQRMLGADAGVGVWSYEPTEQRIYWSDELIELLGLSPQELDNLEAFRRRLTPAAWRRLSRGLRATVLTGERGAYEHQIRTPRGRRTLRVTYHGERRPDGFFAVRGISQDITELAAARDAGRRGERRMREARREALANGRRLKIALEVAQAGVYEIDHVSKTFWASPEFRRLAGCGAATYVDVTELRYPRFHPDDLAHVRESFRALHQGERRSGEAFEARILNDEGRARWVRVFHHLQIARNGRWLKAVGLLHDIDADKRQELALIEAQRAAEAAGEAKAAFLANMSHEIRTPLNGIMGVLHILKKEPVSDDGRQLLDEALSCGQMLAELLNDVIDFSKIEAGRLELAYEPVDPKDLVESVLRLLKPQADAKSLTLVVEPDPQVGWVRTDPVRLRQALFNLAGNAVKFTEHGAVKVRFRRMPAGQLRFEVQDTGVGIPAHVQARIFERFDQGDASTTRRFGGSGLGLSITQRLARMMGGDVGVVSVEGEGSTFWLDIAADAAEPECRAAAADDAILQGLRILVVEDNSTNRMIATKLLEQLGAAVETAPDGYLGVEAAASGSFDLILMDVQMPGIDGLEAARRIRTLGGSAARTPIVALTANVLAHQRQAYLQAGMDGVVGKPISPAELLGEIARLGQAADDETQAVA